jgi:zinc transporter ZupT
MSPMGDPSTVDSPLTEDWKFPLLLSFLAGASTCAGAAIVFLFDSSRIEKSMAFSLSLAGSVMITVSVISIGPECMEGIINWNNGLSVDLPLLIERGLSFMLGCFGYWLLSKALASFPEPESLFFFQDRRKTKKGGETLKQNNEDNKLLSSPKSENRTSPTKTSNNDMFLRRSASGIALKDDEEVGSSDETKLSKESRQRSWRVAMLLFFSLLFHNFPEGLAVGTC